MATTSGKIYNFDFERSKLLNAFGGDVAAAEDFARAQGAKSLNAYAADIVKNTVPNYERVPQFIEGLRKLPVGNFIAFPAEIIRTSFTTLNRSLDESTGQAHDGRGCTDDSRGAAPAGKQLAHWCSKVAVFGTSASVGLTDSLPPRWWPARLCRRPHCI